MTTEQKNKRNFIWNTVGSTIYAFTSLVYLIIVTRINGTDDAGIFTFGFSFACMLFVLGTYSGRTFQVTEQNKELSQFRYLIFKIFTCLAMIIVAFIFTASRQYDFYKSLIIILLIVYKAIDAYSDSIYAVFQTNNNLYQAGISLTIRSCLCVIVFSVVDLFTNDLVCSIIAMNLADISVFIFYDLFKLRHYSIVKNNFTIRVFKILLFCGFSTFAFFFLNQFFINVQKYIIDALLDNYSQTIFGIILMPATFISVCSLLIINPFIYQIKVYVKNNNFIAIRKLATKISIYVSVLGVMTVIAGIFIGIPVLELLYSIALQEYLIDLVVILIGSVFLGLIAVYSNCLISIRENNIQLVLYCISVLFSFCISFLLVDIWGIRGASLSFFISAFLLFVMYIIVFNIKFKRKDDNKKGDFNA